MAKEIVVIDEDRRPNVDCHGNSIKHGDLIQIVSRGFIFHAYVDDTQPDEGARPARQKDKDLEQWFDALDWDTAELIEPAK